MQKIIRMPKASFCTAHADIYGENEDTSARAILLNRAARENGSDGIYPKIEQKET